MKNVEIMARPASKPKKIKPRSKRECFGCGDYFTTYRQANYDYCLNCAINNRRYVNQASHCPECGDGSSWIRFKNQPLRACKLCSLQPRIIQKEVKYA